MRVATIMMLVGATFGLACNRGPKPPPHAQQVFTPKRGPEPAAQPTPPAAAKTPSPSTAPEEKNQPALLTWKAPSGFKQVEPSSPMRRAEYKLGAATVAVFEFHGFKGAAKDTVSRWLSEYSEPGKMVTQKVGELSMLRTNAVGTFKPSMPFSKQEAADGQALEGAAVTLPEGVVLFKLYGPQAEVASASAAFNAMLSGVQKPSPQAADTPSE